MRRRGGGGAVRGVPDGIRQGGDGSHVARVRARVPHGVPGAVAGGQQVLPHMQDGRGAVKCAVRR